MYMGDLSACTAYMQCPRSPEECIVSFGTRVTEEAGILYY